MQIYSCSTTTELASWREQTTEDSTFQKIFVMVLIRDLEYRIILENKITAELNKAGVNAVQSLKKLSPVERYEKDDFDTLLQKNNFDGFLMIKYEGSIEEKKNKEGITYYKYYRKFSRPTRRKGYIESHKIVIFESVLFSVLNEKSIWAATTKTNDSSGPEDLAQSFCEAIIKEFKTCRLIR
ncbi:MAG: hypothetical protein HY959_09725 [Ignavibacteriae bacterium]|nr:hypothetical protein [Ignavibacteriota bacterium]